MKIKFIDYDKKYLADLIRIHKISFKDHFNSRMDNLYTKNFLEWFTRDSEFDPVFILAVDSDTNSLIGYMCGAKDGFYTRITRYLLPYTLITFIKRPYLIFDNKMKDLITPKLNALLGKTEYPQWEAYENTLPHPIYSVTSFALNDKYRNAGFGYFLLNTFFKEFFENVRRHQGRTVRATVRTFNKEIYDYYKFSKWDLAPSNSRTTLRFYKDIEKS